jgi:hypothetical protein
MQFFLAQVSPLTAHASAACALLMSHERGGWADGRAAATSQIETVRTYRRTRSWVGRYAGFPSHATYPSV